MSEAANWCSVVTDHPPILRRTQEEIEKSRAMRKLFKPGGYWKNTPRWIYAIGFQSGIVKVGVGSMPRTRLSAHESYRAEFADPMVWMHTFSRWSERRGAYQAEQLAHRKLRAICVQAKGKEWFCEVTKQAVFVCVREAEREMREQIAADDAELACRWHEY